MWADFFSILLVSENRFNKKIWIFSDFSSQNRFFILPLEIFMFYFVVSLGTKTYKYRRTRFSIDFDLMVEFWWSFGMSVAWEGRRFLLICGFLRYYGLRTSFVTCKSLTVQVIKDVRDKFSFSNGFLYQSHFKTRKENFLPHFVGSLFIDHLIEKSFWTPRGRFFSCKTGTKSLVPSSVTNFWMAPKPLIFLFHPFTFFQLIFSPHFLRQYKPAT